MSPAADAVVTTAAGYTRHSKGDIAGIHMTGNRNLADAANRGGAGRPQVRVGQHPDL
jgi:hypothetical protein